MSIKVLSSIDEALLSRSASTQSAGSVSSIEVSFADALASAQDLLASDELDQAQKNAIRAVTVDAAVDAIRQSGGYGLSLDSALAKSLVLTRRPDYPVIRLPILVPYKLRVLLMPHAAPQMLFRLPIHLLLPIVFQPQEPHRIPMPVPLFPQIMPLTLEMSLPAPIHWRNTLRRHPPLMKSTLSS